MSYRITRRSDGISAARCDYCGGYQARPADDYKCPNCGAPMSPDQFGVEQHALDHPMWMGSPVCASVVVMDGVYGYQVLRRNSWRGGVMGTSFVALNPAAGKSKGDAI